MSNEEKPSARARPAVSPTLSLFFSSSAPLTMADDAPTPPPPAVKPEGGGAAAGEAGGSDANMLTIKVQTQVRRREKAMEAGMGRRRERSRPIAGPGLSGPRTPRRACVADDESVCQGGAPRRRRRALSRRGQGDGRSKGGSASFFFSPRLLSPFLTPSPLSCPPTLLQDGAVIQFKTKRTTAIKKLMKVFAERQGGACKWGGESRPAVCFFVQRCRSRKPRAANLTLSRFPAHSHTLFLLLPHKKTHSRPRHRVLHV